MLIAAEHYASRLVLPASQQAPPLEWRSRGARSLKVVEKLEQARKAGRKTRAARDQPARVDSHPEAGAAGEELEEIEAPDGLDDGDRDELDD